MSRGFTLIEVLAALAIVATALAAASAAGGALVRMVERQTEQWLAQQCAQRALVSIRLDPVFPSPGIREEPCSEGGWDFMTAIDIAPTPNPSFRRVQVRVWRADAPQQVLLRSTTVVGRH